MFCKGICTAGKGADFTVGQKGVPVGEFVFFSELNNGQDVDRDRTIGVMEDSVLRDFGDGVGLVVSEVFDL